MVCYNDISVCILVCYAASLFHNASERLEGNAYTADNIRLHTWRRKLAGLCGNADPAKVLLLKTSLHL